jgi:hypothetical protein
MSHWTEDGFIFYDDYNEGWALDRDCQRVCVCQEADVNKILSGEKPIESVTNPKQREALELILEWRRENDYAGEQATNPDLRASITQQRNNQRIRPNTITRNKLQDVKLPKIERRPSLHTSKRQE